MERVGRWAWPAVYFLGFVTIVFAFFRLLDVADGVESRGLFDVRYDRNPGLTLLHILPGAVFFLIGPFQFLRRIRDRHLNLHRWLGRIYIAAGALAAVSALILAVRLPAFGGVATSSATFVFGAALLVCLGKALYHIKRRQMDLHREWMIRGFAIGLGVSMIRFWILLFQIATDLSFSDVFGTTFWLGFSTTVVGAEVWINLTRARG